MIESFLWFFRDLRKVFLLFSVCIVLRMNKLLHFKVDGR